MTESTTSSDLPYKCNQRMVVLPRAHVPDCCTLVYFVIFNPSSLACCLSLLYLLPATNDVFVVVVARPPEDRAGTNGRVQTESPRGVHAFPPGNCPIHRLLAGLRFPRPGIHVCHLRSNAAIMISSRGQPFSMLLYNDDVLSFLRSIRSESPRSKTPHTFRFSLISNHHVYGKGKAGHSGPERQRW